MGQGSFHRQFVHRGVVSSKRPFAAMYNRVLLLLKKIFFEKLISVLQYFTHPLLHFDHCAGGGEYFTWRCTDVLMKRRRGEQIGGEKSPDRPMYLLSTQPTRVRLPSL